MPGPKKKSNAQLMYERRMAEIKAEMIKKSKKPQLPGLRDTPAVAMAKQKEIKVGTGSQKRAAKREIKTYEKQQAAKASGNTKKAGKLYDKLVKRQTKSAMKGVDVNYGNKKVTYSAPIK